LRFPSNPSRFRITSGGDSAGQTRRLLNEGSPASPVRSPPVAQGTRFHRRRGTNFLPANPGGATLHGSRGWNRENESEHQIEPHWHLSTPFPAGRDPPESIPCPAPP